MRFALFLTLICIASQSHALQFIKCGTTEGKTLYATFGKRVTSGEPTPVYFPIDFVVFSQPQVLQDRVIYYRTKDALLVPLHVSYSAIDFVFPAKSFDGTSIYSEAFDLHVMSPRDPTGFQGRWTTTDADGHKVQTVQTMCSVF
jgi:hypothetical protein